MLHWHMAVSIFHREISEQILRSELENVWLRFVQGWHFPMEGGGNFSQREVWRNVWQELCQWCADVHARLQVSIHAAVIICATLVNTHTHAQTVLTGYTLSAISSASQAKT